MRLLAGASADLQHEEQAEAERPWVHVAAGEAMRQILAQLRQPGAGEGVDARAGLRGTLRPYQRQGVAWLRFVTQLGLGACLADDMGLARRSRSWRCCCASAMKHPHHSGHRRCWSYRRRCWGTGEAKQRGLRRR